jgi:N-acetylglucosaminyl-diphospho-decaprenol L-rhamnosyltransferase
MASSGAAAPAVPRVRAVVLNHDGGDRLVRCVDALAGTQWPVDAFDIVVIDNASRDGSADLVDGRHPNVQVVRNGRNTGFPANNLALRDLRGVDYVALVNNDAYVEPGWLAPLVDTLEGDIALGAACSLLLFANEPVPTVNNAGNEVLPSGYGRDRGFGSTDLAAFAEPADVFAWCGAAVLLRPAYLADVGLFDERFFLYYEDTDLSWRGQLRGWRYRYVPQSRVLHDHAASSVSGSPFQLFHSERNRLVMLVKCAPAGLAARAVLRFPLSAASYALHGNPSRALVHVRAFASFLGLLPHAVRERRRVRGRGIVDDATIIARLACDRPVGLDRPSSRKISRKRY